MNKFEKNGITTHLLEWYDEHARILPWRQNPTPYRVWVSEIMLQQTRVEAVKPYFERFMKALPTLKDLAKADEDVLHKLWEGLGYYNRVKNMKKAAILCMEQYGGTLPGTFEALLKLPGIGPYSAGAIASIAYKERVTAVDGNVLRVFSRLFLCYDDILKESTKRAFQDLVMNYVPWDRPDAFNQAVMEIGAMVCLPNAAPKCEQCPLHEECKAHQEGKELELPIKAKKKKRTVEDKLVDVVVCGDEILLTQRDAQGLLAGLYSFPLFDRIEEEAHFISQFEILNEITLRDAKHIFTHKEWHMKGTLFIVKEKSQGLWCSLDELTSVYALPTALKVYKEAVYQWLQN